MKTLFPPGADPLVTRLNRGFAGARPSASGMPAAAAREGGIVKSAPNSFRLEANVPYILAVQNPRRVGLMLQNLDPAQDLFFNFGAEVTLSSGIIVPRGTILLDFVCPTDQLTVMGAVAMSGYFVEMFRTE